MTEHVENLMVPAVPTPAASATARTTAPSQLRPAPVAGLTVGRADDPAEVAAEARATSVLSRLRRFHDDRWPAGTERSSTAQVEVGRSGGAVSTVRSREISDRLGDGAPLSEAIRRRMEAGFGTSLGHVRVHDGPAAAQHSAALGATAFTVGNDVFLGGGVDPLDAHGEHVLAHEIVHVIDEGHTPERPGGDDAVARPLTGAGASSPVRRAILDNGKPLTWKDLQPLATVMGAPKAALLVIQFWAETTFPTPSVTYENQKKLVKLARDALTSLPTEFAQWMDTWETIVAFKESLDAMKPAPKLSPVFTQALQAQEDALTLARAARLGPAPTLAAPTKDPRYKVSPSLVGKPAAKTGRDDAAFNSTSSSIPGVTKSTTSTVGHHLTLEAIAAGALQQNADGTASQICATCGRVTDATQFEVDHQQAFSELRDNLHMLARGMALSDPLYQRIKATTPAGDFTTFFQVKGTPGTVGCEVVLTKAAVNIYSNDIGNLMKICRQCNGAWGKHDMDMFQWFLSSPFFTDKFIAARLPAPGPDTIIARTNTGEGWGTAARDWFATHHLPVLKQQFVLDAAKRFFHSQVTRQSQLQLEAALEPNPVKKAALEREAETLAGHNAAFGGVVDADREYFSGEQLGRPPAPMAPDSPGKLVSKRKADYVEREGRKTFEKKSATPAYQAGYGHGLARSPSSENLYQADLDMLEAYRLGYRDGHDAHQAEFNLGVSLAMAVPNPSDLAMRATTVTDPAQLAGFRDASARRLDAVNLGRTAGAARAAPDVSFIPSGTPSSEVLLRDYLQAYASGMTAGIPPSGVGDPMS
ncbi:hypothetical protein ASD16_06295 [Cellulomonas sp. Root485]|uniref:eCIS core domain-containing protein n=1 Tax=Cellulomonas sp. Root485 TaxID=1736546 RepID=UPI00070112A0|nr:DUF4157 domain-containing protein [Cellulomonas sp. Root485]KQY25056.1 hypothetical protein ASD16_06295 [Cellulomonas sp. Root485]